jgi:hypothetical protein
MPNDLPPPPRVAATRGRASCSCAGSLVGVLLAGALACGGTEVEPAPEPAGCVANADCGEGQICEAGSCMQSIPPTTISAGAEACSVVSCPGIAAECCSSAAASATGNQRDDHTTLLHMLQSVDSTDGTVRADYRFDAANQQGWIIFELGAELSLREIEIIGRHDGVSDRFLSVNVNQSDGGGCAFAFEFDPWPPNAATAFTTERGARIGLEDADHCYRNGRPGLADELAFAIFSNDAGTASLMISRITLTAR